MHYLRVQQVWTKSITRPKETTELEENDSTQVPFPCVHSCSTFTQGRCCGHFLWYIFMPSFSRQVAALLWYLDSIVCGRLCQHCNETRPRFLSPHGYFAYTILSTAGFAPDISTLQFYAFYTIKTFSLVKKKDNSSTMFLYLSLQISVWYGNVCHMHVKCKAHSIMWGLLELGECCDPNDSYKLQNCACEKEKAVVDL